MSGHSPTASKLTLTPSVVSAVLVTGATILFLRDRRDVPARANPQAVQ